MTVDDIIQTIRDDHGGAFWGVFHVAEGGFKFLPTGHILTPAAHRAVVRHFTGEEPAPCQPMTPAEKAKARAHRAVDRHG